MLEEIFAKDLRPEILLRFLLTMVAGFILGAEREIHGRAAGLRTTMIVCLSACVAMVVSDEFYRESFEGPPVSWHPDPARLAAGILAGMGFLGAGVIVHQRTNVIRGVTTAATLWFAAIVGIALGGGSLAVGVVSTVLGVVVLNFMPRFEDHFQNDWYSELEIVFRPEGPPILKVREAIEAYGIKIKGLDWNENVSAETRTLLFHLKYKKGDRLDFPSRVIADLRKLDGVSGVHWRG